MSGVPPVPFLHAFIMWTRKTFLFFFLIPQLIALNFGAYEGRRHSNAAEKLKLPMQYVIGAQLPLYLLQNES